MKENGRMIDEIDEMKIKNVIIASHQEFIQEQHRRFEDILSSLSDIVKCPILMEVMEDPVMADDHHTYERSAIAQWIETRGTSPLTRERISAVLRPNMIVRQLVEELKKKDLSS
eukprot:TRINITY_DN1152_c1_g1_i1.p2 TRINITY_DN1152_c1_g1~~TRINITY_DN1152_c1_g1_i1.p2  ORF type:complete len:114 (-),score=46.73 TRINITY_DN1152_c1_g1_i1:205-546(-)